MSDGSHDVLWQALADGTRRTLLDLLRDGPRTTGALAASFEMTRFGVMKHLGVLEQAGLVVVRREGRQRFNHLNAVPLQRLHERWVRWNARPAASSLLALERHLNEQPVPTGEERPMNDNPNLSFHIEQEITLQAPRSQVWKALTHDVGKWWAFHVGPDTSAITLDGKVGGHFIERWGDGEAELYATVTYLRMGEKITLEGAMGMGGPGYSKFSYALEEHGQATKLKLTHYCHGYRDPEVANNYTEGWQLLLGTHLTAWVQDGTEASAKSVSGEP